MKNQMSYFMIKTRLDYADGKTIEGYTAYDFNNDETIFTAQADAESICVFMSLKTCDEMAKKILGWTPKYTSIRDIIQTAWNWEEKRKF